MELEYTNHEVTIRIRWYSTSIVVIHPGVGRCRRPASRIPAPALGIFHLALDEAIAYANQRGAVWAADCELSGGSSLAALPT